MQTEPETTRVAQYGCHMQIRRDAITQNLATLRDKVTCRMIAVLKNDGYGLTLTQYARLLADGGITAFAGAAWRKRRCCGKTASTAMCCC